MNLQSPTLTDASGNFLISGLAPGAYQLVAEKKGYGRNSVAVFLGPSSDALSLRLEPYSKIVGKVTDDEGEPVPGLSVRGLLTKIEDGRRSVEEVSTATTDDRGQYLLYYLRHGEYYVAVAGREGGSVAYFGSLNSAPVREGFSPVYYPAARDRASATPIALAPGQEFTADLKVAMQPAFRVGGTLRNLSPREVVKVELLSIPGEIGANQVLVNSMTGRFAVFDVVPGTYLLRASQGEGATETRGLRQLQVSSAGVDDVIVELLPGVKVTGVVRGDSLTSAKGQTIAPGCSVTLVPLDQNPDLSSLLPVSSGADGKFAIDAVPQGRYRVQVETGAWYVSSLTYGTQDLSHGAELVIDPGAAPAPLEITLRTDFGSLAGTIEASAKVEDGADVLLAPAVGGEAELANVSQGKFEFQRLAPGDYQLFLFKNLDNIEYNNPEVLRRLKGAENVHITGGSRTAVTLKAVAQ